MDDERRDLVAKFLEAIRTDPHYLVALAEAHHATARRQDAGQRSVITRRARAGKEKPRTAQVRERSGD